MTDPGPFALAVLLVGAAGLAAVVSNRISSWLRVPAPALVFAAAVVAVAAIPDLHAPSRRTVEQLVTVALTLILFDGGAQIGWRRLRPVTATVTAVGIGGTFATVGGLALLLHYAIRLDWYPALLVATAIAPTDPAVVFSVFGQREVSGRSGVILEGESGANDPVGIALMASLISAGHLAGSAALHVAGEFAAQLAVGLIIGVVGGVALRRLARVPMPHEGLASLRSLASVLVIFGVATLAHGSGFLAVFVAGIAAGGTRAPYQREVERFHKALASVAEVAAFVVLGLTVKLADLGRADVLVPGLVTAIVLTVVIRPGFVAPFLVGSKLRRGEGLFVLFAGLKGAVPILLGTLLLTAHVPDPHRLYAIVVIVVLFSVVVQASLVPVVAERLHIPMRPAGGHDPDPGD
jgi:cell volume regulation protein A